MAWPQYIAIAIFAPTVLRLFGSDFTEGSSTVAILAVSLLVGSALLGPVDMVLLMSGKSMWGLWNTALSLTVNLGLNILLIPRLGIEGAGHLVGCRSRPRQRRPARPDPHRVRTAPFRVLSG